MKLLVELTETKQSTFTLTWQTFCVIIKAFIWTQILGASCYTKLVDFQVSYGRVLDFLTGWT